VVTRAQCETALSLFGAAIDEVITSDGTQL